MTSPDLAAQIAASPRFKGDSGEYFNEVAANYGLDITGLAWIQASLAVDQIPARVARVADSTASDPAMRALFADIMRVAGAAKRAGLQSEFDAATADIQAGSD